MKTAHQEYIEQADQAGYLVQDDNTALVVDRGEFFHIVCENNNDGGWLVGRFYKQTFSRSGDYSGCPDFEHDDLEECVKFVSHFTQ